MHLFWLTHLSNWVVLLVFIVGSHPPFTNYRAFRPFHRCSGQGLDSPTWPKPVRRMALREHHLPNRTLPFLLDMGAMFSCPSSLAFLATAISSPLRMLPPGVHAGLLFCHVIKVKSPITSTPPSPSCYCRVLWLVQMCLLNSQAQTLLSFCNFNPPLTADNFPFVYSTLPCI